MTIDQTAGGDVEESSRLCVEQTGTLTAVLALLNARMWKWHLRGLAQVRSQKMALAAKFCVQGSRSPVAFHTSPGQPPCCPPSVNPADSSLQHCPA